MLDSTHPPTPQLPEQLSDVSALRRSSDEDAPERYDAVAVALHWVLAIVLMTLVGSGLYMVSLPDLGFNINKIF
jgi:hypothetical protein